MGKIEQPFQLLRDVAPRLGGQGVPNGGPRDAILSGQRRYRGSSIHVTLSDVLNAEISQLSQRVPLPAHRRGATSRAATLCHHVLGIVAPRALEQMAVGAIVPHARRIVAAVQGAHAWQQGAPELPLQCDSRSLQRRIIAPAGIDLPVAVLISRTGPLPARPEVRADDRAVLVDLRPKSLYQRAAGDGGRAIKRCTRTAAKPLARIPGISNAGYATVLTGKLPRHQAHSLVSRLRSARTLAGAFGMVMVP